MNLAPVYLVKNKTLTSDSGTIYVDLPLNEQISCLVFEFNATKTATADHTNPIFDQIGNIDVLLDGSKTAYHAEVEVGSIMAWLSAGKLPSHDPRERGIAQVCLPIYFGRWPGDLEYGLDTSGYKSAQLMVAYSVDTTDWTTAVSSYSVYYMRPVVPVSWRGFVRQRTINLITHPASAATEYVDLPHGLPWLRVGIRNYDWDEYIYSNLSAIKLTVDDGRISLLAADTDDIININRERYGADIPGYPIVSFFKHADAIPTYLALTRMVDFCAFQGQVYCTGINSYKGHHVDVSMIDHAGAAIAADQSYFYRPTGYCPHGGLVLFDNALDPFPAPAHANGKIELTVGAFASVTETFLQELVEGKL